MLKLVVVVLALSQSLPVFGFNSDSRYQFTSKLFHDVFTSQPHDNIILSPASVQTCMALTYMGAEGQTADELKKGLFLESFGNKEDVAADFGEFLRAVGKSDSAKLQMANRIYVGKDFEIAPAFNELATKHFQSKAAVVNFAEKQAAADTINEWVKSETHDKIQNLIKPSVLSEDTAAVLVNAIYFKAEWQNRFDRGYTKDVEFHLGAKETKEVPMMFRTNMPVRYCEVPALDVKVAELLYKDTDLRMIIVLPNKVDGLVELEKKLNFDSLFEFDKLLLPEDVDVSLPKFKIEYELGLVETLMGMGMTTVFSDGADLHGMLTTNKPLKVSDVRHKAFISVDENGSEAAAAAYSQVSSRLARLKKLEFRVDRPFVFGIRDDHAVYFLGHVVKL